MIFHEQCLDLFLFETGKENCHSGVFPQRNITWAIFFLTTRAQELLYKWLLRSSQSFKEQVLLDRSCLEFPSAQNENQK